MSYEASKTAKVDEFDVVGEVFALKYVKREEYGDLVELYVEDDGAWYFKMNFSSWWVSDLIAVLSGEYTVLPQPLSPTITEG
jgi:hypothetical protein